MVIPVTLITYMEMNMSDIKRIHKGKFVQVDLVDTTLELTVDNNVYSLSESHELFDEMYKAMCKVYDKVERS
jgi:hypothetical protein|tara:strand:+ start:489 stop:704 length:216 start_codon:yes stop_codon:yes gene_type:complete